MVGVWGEDCEGCEGAREGNGVWVLVSWSVYYGRARVLASRHSGAPPLDSDVRAVSGGGVGVGETGGVALWQILREPTHHISF